MKNTVLWAFAAGAAVAVVAVALRLTEEQRHAKRAEVLADLSERVDQLADTVHKEADLVLAKTLDVTAQSVDTADRSDPADGRAGEPERGERGDPRDLRSRQGGEVGQGRGRCLI